MKKIAVAMSGGVDSSVAAALMVKKYGKENVFGITMRFFCYGENEGGEKSCCSLEAVSDAKNVCDQLGIPHYAISFEKEFEKDVIDNFVSEYEKGHTPNPCIRCNQFIKYEHLLKKAQGLGADILVTGHYARVSFSCHPEEQGGKDLRREDLDCRVVNSELTSRNDRERKFYHLLKGKDTLKDQSYFLYNLTQDQLAHVEFPIGELEKTETRKLAAEFGLKTAQKTESQDICFVPTTVEEFLEKKVAFKPGNIVDKDGKVVGEHRGLAFYTIGQRRGLGGGFKDVMYVTGINKEKNEVVIGPEKELFSETLVVEKPHWILKTPKMPIKCTAKIRYQAVEADCVVESLNLSSLAANQGSFPESLDSRFRGNDGGVLVTFANPQKAITPGQSVVFYSGEEVLGGGVIS